MSRTALRLLIGLAGILFIWFAPYERLQPQAKPLTGEPCPVLGFDQVRDLRFGANDAYDRGLAVKVRRLRGEAAGHSCRGLFDRLDCRITAPGPVMVKSKSLVRYFEVPQGRSARVRAHRQMISCALDPVAATPGTDAPVTAPLASG
jgi:hypothetical protein